MLRHLLLTAVILSCFIAPSLAIADSHNPKRIMPQEVMTRLTAGEKILFLDTRTSADWNAGSEKIQDAYRVANDETLNQILGMIPPDRLIVTYCT